MFYFISPSCIELSITYRNKLMRIPVVVAELRKNAKVRLRERRRTFAFFDANLPRQVALEIDLTICAI